MHALIYEGEEYDPAVSGAVVSLTLELTARKSPGAPPGTIVNHVDGAGLQVAIRQDVGGGDLIYRSDSDDTVTFVGPDPGIWEPVSIEVLDLELFTRSEADGTPVDEQPDFTEPFYVGVVWATTTGIGQHISGGCPGGDHHNESHPRRLAIDDFEVTVEQDVDGDGVADNLDNCTLIANAPPADCDTDSDGYGNACDGDFDNGGGVAPFDFTALFLPDFASGTDSGIGSDMDCGGGVAPFDFTAFFIPKFSHGTPGPSGLVP